MRSRLWLLCLEGLGLIQLWTAVSTLAQTSVSFGTREETMRTRWGGRAGGVVAGEGRGAERPSGTAPTGSRAAS